MCVPVGAIATGERTTTVFEYAHVLYFLLRQVTEKMLNDYLGRAQLPRRQAYDFHERPAVRLQCNERHRARRKGGYFLDVE